MKWSHCRCVRLLDLTIRHFRLPSTIPTATLLAMAWSCLVPGGTAAESTYVVQELILSINRPLGSTRLHTQLHSYAMPYEGKDHHPPPPPLKGCKRADRKANRNMGEAEKARNVYRSEVVSINLHSPINTLTISAEASAASVCPGIRGEEQIKSWIDVYVALVLQPCVHHHDDAWTTSFNAYMGVQGGSSTKDVTGSGLV